MPSSSTRTGDLALRGMAYIRSQQAPSGAYPASPTFSAYRGYSWLRDGAFIADAMSAAGDAASATAFFDWCAHVVGTRAERIAAIAAAAERGEPMPDGEMLPTRFRLDGTEGGADWWDFQLDGYGLWLWAASAHAARHDLPAARWAHAVALTVDYLCSSWDRPCYDWWEEHVEEVHVSTLGSIEAGLRAAAGSGELDDDRRARAFAVADAAAGVIRERGVADGHLVKWIGSSEVDASLAAIVAPLGVVDPRSELAMSTIAEIERRLVVDGGTHRFAADTYYGGGQWPLLSCFLGLAHLASGDADRARELLDWAAGTAHPDGTVPEQVDRHLLAPGRRDEWVARWGEPADPLLWSSAMLLRLAVELGEVIP